MACLTPFTIKNPNRKLNADLSHIPVPCGKCPDCLARRSRSWIFRLLQEEKMHKRSLFITLTYSPDFVPRSERGLLTLNKKHLQDFWKRLRKLTGCKTIKYYACGEYGENYQRPHYHAIVFDVDEESVKACWPFGIVHFGQVNGKTIAYTCEYMNKVRKIPMFNGDDRLPEFSHMSKGMGINYLQNNAERHKSELASYVVDNQGYKVVMPRYYRDKIFDDNDKAKLNWQSQVLFADREAKLIEEAGSIEEYHRLRHERLKAYLENYKQKQKQKRLKDGQ